MKPTRSVDRKAWSRSLIVLVAGILLAGLTLGGAGPVPRMEGTAFAAMAADKPAPDFELKDLGGSTVRIGSFKGQKAVLVYFWATWCPYCVKAKPKVAELRKDISESEMAILAINVGGTDSLEHVKRFQEINPVSWPVLYDKDGSVAKKYHVVGIPLFVLVNKEGNMVYVGNSLPDPMDYLKKK